MKRMIPFAIGMLISASAYAEKPLHDWVYYYRDNANEIALSTSEADGHQLWASCPSYARKVTPQECATRIERDLLTPAVSCALIGETISCKIP